MGTDWIGDSFKGSGGHASEHPFDHNPIQQIALGEHTEGLQPDFLAAVGDPNPGTANREFLTSHHYRRRRGSATHVGPFGVTCVPIPSQRVGLRAHHRHCRSQAGVDRYRHQALSAQFVDPGQLDRQLRWEESGQVFIGGVENATAMIDNGSRYLAG